MNPWKVYNQERQRVTKLIAEFKREVDFEWAKSRKVDYLLDRIVILRLAVAKYEQMREDERAKEPRLTLHRQLINRRLKDFYREFDKTDRSLKYWMFEAGKKNDTNIPGELIAMAREYPISRLVEVRGASSALCPFHDDRRPSMYVRGGYYHCFACGASGDAIDFVMRREGLSFPEAVKYLEGGIT